MPVYILGGGPAGLAVADGLIDLGTEKFVLIERGPQLGGLAQTLHWEGAGYHDLGPHKIFSLDQTLVTRVEALRSPDEWLTRDKTSRIFMNGHFLPYPPSPFSLAGVFGVPTFARMVFGYAAARLRGLAKSSDPATFEDDLVGRVGRNLYDVLFKPIAVKLWGDPRRLDVKLSRGRVQTPKLTEVVGRMLGLKKQSEFETFTFRYPRGGLNQLWQSIAAKAHHSGQFLLNHTVEGLDVKDRAVVGIRCRLKTGGEVKFDVGPGDFVVSSLPLGLSTKLLQDALPPRIPELVANVVALNDLLLVFLHVDVPSVLPESWVFVPDPKIAFHRVSEQESFDPGMTPNGSIVCCEIMSNDARQMAKCSDAELIAAAKKGLADMGYTGLRSLSERVIRLPQSYPVFRPGFEDGLREILAELDGFSNFRSLGRQGGFNYIGTMDAMDIGYGFARWYARRDTLSWHQERERTGHYPVLD